MNQDDQQAAEHHQLELEQQMPTLLLNEETHTYTDNGIVVPGVTSVIDHLCDLTGIPRDILDHKSYIGKAAHKACELHDLDVLNWSTVDYGVLPYLVAWINFLKDSGFDVLLNEHLVFHKRHNYAGMLDRVGVLNGEISLIDIKCTAVIGPHAGVQLSAYFEAENSTRIKADKITKRYAVQLRPDETYRLIPFTDRSDFSVFLSCLLIHNWKLKHDKLK